MKPLSVADPPPSNPNALPWRAGMLLAQVGGMVKYGEVPPEWRVRTLVVEHLRDRPMVVSA